MLPVQTVMIRYMVLVYRWGDGWLGAAGDWSGFAGGFVGGRMRSPVGTRGGALATGARGYMEAPPTRGRRGLLGVSATWLIFPAPSQIHLEALQARSCNQISVFSYPKN